MIRGTADGMVAGTAVGMILGFTARPAIGATVHPSVSAGVGVVSMPATGARLGAGVRVIGDLVIGVAATGVAGMAAVIGDITTTGTVVLAGAGAEVEAVVGQVLPIPIVVLPDKAVTGILLLFVVMVRVPFVPVALLFGEALQFVQKVVLFVLLVLLIVGELLPDV